MITLEKKPQVIESQEDLGALVEGDIVDTQRGRMLYTEQYGGPRLIKQFDSANILSVSLNAKEGDKVSVNKGRIIIEEGHLVNIFSNDRVYGWVQYDLDSGIIESTGL